MYFVHVLCWKIKLLLLLLPNFQSVHGQVTAEQIDACGSQGNTAITHSTNGNASEWENSVLQWRCMSLSVYSCSADH